MYVEFNGGLGNQFFQYSFYLWLRYRYPDIEIKVFPYYSNKDNSMEIEKVLGINLERCSIEEYRKYGALKKILPFRIARILKISPYKNSKNIITEKNFGTKKLLPYSYFRGFWQSENYFKDISNVIKREFVDTLRSGINDMNNLSYIEQIVNTYSVSIHIRRGDYLEKHLRSYFINLSETSYYTNAINYVKNINKEAKFFIFSNDIEWCRKRFVGDEFYFIDLNHGENSWKDIVLMSYCKANIVANSSFSWWGAYLGESSTVIAPAYIGKKFDKDHPDYFPSNWIKL